MEPEQLQDPNERLARMIVWRKHVSGSKVHANAFKPPKDWQLSVFVEDDLKPEELFAIADKFVTKPQGRIFGFARSSVGSATQEKLLVWRDDDPPQHAYITGWPPGDEGKARRLLMAAKLASLATYVANPASQNPTS